MVYMTCGADYWHGFTSFLIYDILRDGKIEKNQLVVNYDRLKNLGGKMVHHPIRYLWVRQMSFNDATVVYVPTEGNLPILEAGLRP